MSPPDNRGELAARHRWFASGWGVLSARCWDRRIRQTSFLPRKIGFFFGRPWTQRRDAG